MSKLTDESADFEKLLFKLHQRRKRDLSQKQKQRIANLLLESYRIFQDVRFFNEFLWYSDLISHMKLQTEGESIFYDLVNTQGHHQLPRNLQSNLTHKTAADLSVALPEKVESKRICLIGFPPFFGKLYRKLKRSGHDVRQFFVPYHPNRNIHRFLQVKWAVKFLSLLSGNPYPYVTLSNDIYDPRTKKILSKFGFDLGFHKLNFIIRDNIYSAFKYGLVNDHWGYLPLLRGKSTIAYSVLLNVPLVSTFHLVTKGIDQGPIVGYYPLKNDMTSTLRNLRMRLRKTLPARSFAAIQYMSRPGFKLKTNPLQSGLTYYEMHPWLKHYTESLTKHYKYQT